jgi:mRNA interferase RelE/StbE
MRYNVRITDAAAREIKWLSPEVARRVTEKIDRLAEGATGDVKRLRNFAPRYRLRVGDWRVLFEYEGNNVVIHHVSHRSKAYE